MFIAGFPLIIGPGKTVAYFSHPSRLRATSIFGFGAFLVFIGWPMFGLAIEAFGFLNLFGCVGTLRVLVNPRLRTGNLHAQELPSIGFPRVEITPIRQGSHWRVRCPVSLAHHCLN